MVGAVVRSALPAGAQAQQSAPQSETPVTLTVAEMATLEAIVARMIPSD